MCSVKSSQSLPSAATTKCTLCSMSPVMKCTLRDKRSSLETISGHRPDLASFSAVASPDRSSSASAHAPVCTSWCQDLTANPSRNAKPSISWRCAANPKPLRPCSRVLTLKYPIAACIVRPSRRWRHDMPARSRPARSAGNGTRCRAVDGFAACAAHRSHLVRSGPGGNRSRIARRSVMRAACWILLGFTIGSIVQPAA